MNCNTWNVPEFTVFSGPYFPAFGLSTEIYFVNIRIQSKCGNIRTRENSESRHFSHIVLLRLKKKVIHNSLSRHQENNSFLQKLKGVHIFLILFLLKLWVISAVGYISAHIPFMIALCVSHRLLYTTCETIWYFYS